MPYATNNGVKIHYEVKGHGPPLMLVHGFGISMDCWRQYGYAKELSKDYRLILIDVRGFGASDKPHDASAYGFQSLVDDMVAVLDDLDIDKANCFGYSMGGQICFRIPIHAPQRFSSLIIGAAAYPEDSSLLQVYQRLENAIREAPEKPMEFYVATGEKTTGPLSPAVRAELLANDARALLAFTRMFRSEISPKAEEVLPKIMLPCLLFVGEADTRFQTVRECAVRIPGARFISLPGLNHMQGILRSDLVLPHVRGFLTEVKAD